MNDGSWLVSYQELHNALTAVLDRNVVLEDRLRRALLKLEEKNVLLNSALHELAAARPKKSVSVSQFISTWYRQREGGRL